MKKTLITLFITTLFSPVFSQEENKHAVISIIPTSIANAAYRIDFEKGITDRTALIIGPELIFNKIKKNIGLWNTEAESRERNSQLKGIGTNLGIKVYTNNLNRQAFYLGGMANYRYLEVDYLGETWVKVIDEDLPYYIPQVQEKTISINQISLYYIMGLTLPVKEKFLLDIYVGSGIKKAFSNGESDPEAAFDENIFRPAYTGPTVIAGIKVGGIL